MSYFIADVIARRRPTCSGAPQPVSWRPQSECDMNATVTALRGGGGW